eukprot:PhF_6_TR13044/c0_g1_i1/m.20704/K13509/AGPAT1_2; lysophosphatidate acyltransferase
MADASPPDSPTTSQHKYKKVHWTPPTIFRFISFVITLFSAIMVCLILSPINLLNPILRRFGWKADDMPGSRLFLWAAGSTIFAGGIKVLITKPSKPEPTGPCIVMFTHGSNLDPIITTWAVGRSPKFVFKRELAFVPLLGWVLYLYGHIPINRAKREDAIQSLKRAAKNIVTKQKSVAISPEGTRSRHGDLQPFKRGPFHLAQECEGVPIVPVVIRNAYELCPPKATFFNSGYVHVTILDPIPTSKDMSVDVLSDMTENAIKEELRRKVFIPEATPDLMLGPILVNVMFGLVCAWKMFG